MWTDGREGDGETDGQRGVQTRINVDRENEGKLDGQKVRKTGFGSWKVGQKDEKAG